MTEPVRPLAGGTAVVTGASRGSGARSRSGCQMLAPRCALWARDTTALRAVASEIAQRGGRAQAIVCDVTDSSAVNGAADVVRRTMAPVRVLVNNAGIALRKATIAITDADWRAVMAANVDGTFYVTRTFLPTSRDRAGG